MRTIFLQLFDMSLSAGFLMAAVILLRLLLKNAPKSATLLLWALVAVRLICPFMPHSPFSLLPTAQFVTPPTAEVQDVTVQSGIEPLDEAMAEVVPAVTTPSMDLLTVATWVWVGGLAVGLVYAAVSYLRVRHRVRESWPLENGVYLCDGIETAFIIGLFRPRVYLPSYLNEKERKYVLAHEHAHLKNGDHWWKAIGFLLLCVYWFHPLVWVSYMLFCRDVELACDERAIRSLGEDSKAAYSYALINGSDPRRRLSFCPLAFGEVGVKARIRAVLRYKKPALWVMVIALVLCCATAVCFLTDPFPMIDKQPTEGNTEAETTLPTEVVRTICGTRGHDIVHVSCTSAGGCSRCGKMGEAPLPHAFSKLTCTEGEICADCGAKGQEAPGHSFSAATCTKNGTCARCGAIGSYALGHSYTAATTSAPRTCTRCGATSGSPLPNHFHLAKCTSYRCSLCGQTVPAGKHVYGGVPEHEQCIFCGVRKP